MCNFIKTESMNQSIRLFQQEVIINSKGNS